MPYTEEITKLKDALYKNHSMPFKPASFGTEYEFPEEVSKLPSITLGSWLVKMAAWRGYTLRMLAGAEMEEKVMEEYLASKIALKMATSEVKLTKDLALGHVLLDQENAKLRLDYITKEAQVVALKRILEIYTSQFDAISREISRRGIESRIIQQGVSE
jgi:hypothetical protein